MCIRDSYYGDDWDEENFDESKFAFGTESMHRKFMNILYEWIIAVSYTHLGVYNITYVGSYKRNHYRDISCRFGV